MKKRCTHPFNISFILLLTTFATSCNEKDDAVTEPAELESGVYAAGFYFDGAEAQAVYWMDSVPTPVTSGEVPAIATSLAVRDEVVHVVGYEDEIAKYWKNGIAESLSGAGKWSRATDVAVFQDDVYIAGYATDAIFNQVATYWKNGERHPLTTTVASNPVFANANAIAVTLDGVYVAGDVLYPLDGEAGATIWVNGVATRLSLLRSVATDIAVQGDDIYVVGSIRNQAVIWKNGEPTMLTTTDGYEESEAAAVFIDGTDVYVAGYSQGEYAGFKYDYQRACLWKNGQCFMLGSGKSEAYSIGLFDNELYVAGVDSSRACYWKDGVKHELGNGVVYKITVNVE